MWTRISPLVDKISRLKLKSESLDHCKLSATQARLFLILSYFFVTTDCCWKLIMQFLMMLFDIVLSKRCNSILKYFARLSQEMVEIVQNWPSRTDKTDWLKHFIKKKNWYFNFELFNFKLILTPTFRFCPTFTSHGMYYESVFNDIDFTTSSDASLNIEYFKVTMLSLQEWNVFINICRYEFLIDLLFYYT